MKSRLISLVATNCIGLELISGPQGLDLALFDLSLKSDPTLSEEVKFRLICIQGVEYFSWRLGVRLQANVTKILYSCTRFECKYVTSNMYNVMSNAR